MSEYIENIKSELQQWNSSYLIDIQHINVFSMPDQSYFASNLAHIEEKGLLFPYSSKMLFEVPENYFNDLNANIATLVTEDQESETDAFSFEKQKIATPFKVPVNYFENLRPDFLDTEERIYMKKERAKVVSIFQKANKYVAAAVLLVSINIGANVIERIKEEKKVYQKLNNMDINGELADVPTDEILNYLNESSSKDIEYLINSKGHGNPVESVISPNKNKESKGRKTIKGASDEEILQFLSDEDQDF